MPSAVVSAGAGHTACFLSALAGDGSDANANQSVSLYTWGQGEDGQLGHGDSEDVSRPREVTEFADANVQMVCCGAHHTIAVVTGAPDQSQVREVYAWGWGDFGRLGTGDHFDRTSPAIVPLFSGVAIQHVACGDSHCLVVTVTGQLYTFGRNQNGQLGLGDTDDRLAPCLVKSLLDKNETVNAAAGGAEHSAVTTSGGHMFTFGWGRYGNLGHGHCDDVHVPQRVEALVQKNVFAKEPICGWRHSAALTDEGRLWTFGWSKYGQLGHGDNVDSWLPKLLPEFGGGPITSASGGWRHMCALAGSTGTLYAWGWNAFGQLGVGSLDDANAPVAVIVTDNAQKEIRVKSVACGWRHTVAVAGADEDVYTWGRCVHGQLGHGDTTRRAAPTKVEDLALLRQGIAPLAKRARVENDMQVPSQSNKHKKAHNDFEKKQDAAVPEG